jgi:hypothetical protein
MTDPAMSFGEKTIEPKPSSTLTLHADLVRKIRELVIEGDLASPARHFAKRSKHSLRKIYSSYYPVAARGLRS